MLELFQQMVSLPMTMAAGWMNLMAGGLGKIGRLPLGSGGCAGCGGSAAVAPPQPTTSIPGLHSSPNTWSASTPRPLPGAPSGVLTQSKEERAMSDCSCKCNDEMVKLVEYSIVSIKPCEERIIYKGEEIYAEAMSPEAFAGWVIALYLQRPHHEPIPHSEKKFLRVYQRVLDEWPRPDDCCQDSKTLGALEQINQSILKVARGLTPQPQPAAAAS